MGVSVLAIIGLRQARLHPREGAEDHQEAIQIGREVEGDRSSALQPLSVDTERELFSSPSFGEATDEEDPLSLLQRMAAGDLLESDVDPEEWARLSLAVNRYLLLQEANRSLGRLLERGMGLPVLDTLSDEDKQRLGKQVVAQIADLDRQFRSEYGSLERQMVELVLDAVEGRLQDPSVDLSLAASTTDVDDRSRPLMLFTGTTPHMGQIVLQLREGEAPLLDQVMGSMEVVRDEYRRRAARLLEAQ